MNKKTAVAIIYLLFFLSIGTFSNADVINDLRASISQKNSELEQIQKEIGAYQIEIEKTGEQKSSLNKTLQTLETTRKKLLAEIKATEKKISIANTSIEKLNLDIEDKNERLLISLSALGASLRNIDLLESQTLVELTLSNKKISDIWESVDALSSVEKALKAHIDDVKELKQELESNKKQKETEKNKLIGLKGGLADQKQIVENNKSEKNKLLKETKNKESEYLKMLNEQLLKKEQLEQEISDFESKLRIEIDPTSLPPTGRGVLSWPLDSIKITQYFGNTPFASENPQVYNGGGHNGVDFRASRGTSVKAALAGRVIDTGDTDSSCYGVSYGKWVLIEHDNGLSTLYAHLDLIKVSQNETVSTGQVIGYSGNTGYSTGPHLHFAVFAGKAVHVSEPSGPNEYKSKICGTYLKIPVSPRNGYLNPLSYL